MTKIIISALVTFILGFAAVTPASAGMGEPWDTITTSGQ